MDHLNTLRLLLDYETAVRLMQSLSIDKLDLTIATLRRMKSRQARMTYIHHLLGDKASHSVMGTLLVEMGRENRKKAE